MQGQGFPSHFPFVSGAVGQTLCALAGSGCAERAACCVAGPAAGVEPLEALVLGLGKRRGARAFSGTRSLDSAELQRAWLEWQIGRAHV